MKAGAELEHRRDLPTDDDLARSGLQDAGDALEQGRLAGAVPSDNPERLAGVDLELDVA